MPRLRFSIRDLLWLTLVVGMAVGWWADQSRWTGQRKAWQEWQAKWEPNPTAPLISTAGSRNQEAEARKAAGWVSE